MNRCLEHRKRVILSTSVNLSLSVLLPVLLSSFYYCGRLSAWILDWNGSDQSHILLKNTNVTSWQPYPSIAVSEAVWKAIEVAKWLAWEAVSFHFPHSFSIGNLAAKCMWHWIEKVPSTKRSTINPIALNGSIVKPKNLGSNARRKVRNLHSVKNLNTLTYLVINVRALAKAKSTSGGVQQMN